MDALTFPEHRLPKQSNSHFEAGRDAFHRVPLLALFSKWDAMERVPTGVREPCQNDNCPTKPVARPTFFLFAAIAWLQYFSSVAALAAAEISPSLFSSFLSPSMLVSDTNGSTLFIACEATNRVAVFDTGSGKIIRWLMLPVNPTGLALSPDNKRLYVTGGDVEGIVSVLDTTSGQVLSIMPAGHYAMAPVLSRDEKTLFVCDRFDDSIGVIDLADGKLVTQIKVEREPVTAAITPDGKWLFVANHIHAGRSDLGVVAASVSVIDAQSRKLVKHIPLPNGSTLLRGICVSPDGQYVAVAHTLARFHLPTTHVDHGWMNDNALSLIHVAQTNWINTVLLDNLDRGAANPWSIAWSADGQRICVTHAGTHELSIINAPALLAKLSKLPVQLEPGTRPDYSTSARTVGDVPNDLAFLVGLRSRIKLPGKGPRGLALAGNRAFVSHFFSDSLAMVDYTAPAPVANEYLLSPELKLSLARKGEMHFNDGTLCYQGWQSCSSCHSSDARVDGMNWDLLNDGIGNPKNVKSLLLSFETGPAMAMGVRQNAGAAVRAGIKHILFAELPEEYALEIDEYLKTLKPLPSPHLIRGELSPAATRGQRLFKDKSVGCINCHPPPLYTDAKPHAVGSGKFDEPADRFYTPTLIESWRTAPYLHDGRAATLRDAVTTHNAGNQRGLTSQLALEQVDDLVAFLESL